MICIMRSYHKTDIHQNKAVPAGQWIPAFAGMTVLVDIYFQYIEKVYYLRYNLCRIHRDVGSGCDNPLV